MKAPEDLQALSKSELLSMIEELQTQNNELTRINQNLQAGGVSHVLCPKCGTSFQATNLSQSDVTDDLLDHIKSGREMIFSLKRGTMINRFIDDITHTYKNELTELLRALEEYATSSPGKKDEIIRTQINVIKSRIGYIEKEFSTTAYTRVDTNSIIQNMVRFFNHQFGVNTISILPACKREIPDILANEGEIKEIIFNLLSNSVKAVQQAGRKQGQIRIATDIVVRRRIEFIQVTVQDNGIGIRKENEGRIFERGYSTYVGGTGMGLFIVAKIVNSYGGKIELNSTVGKGAEFTVLIPIKRNIA